MAVNGRAHAQKQQCLPHLLCPAVSVVLLVPQASEPLGLRHTHSEVTAPPLGPECSGSNSSQTLS